MSVLIWPLTKDREGLQYMPERLRRAAKNSVGKMPTVYVAYREGEEINEENTAAVGFRYRRQSHSCELTYWHGLDPDLLGQVTQACVMQSILEGRKRCEIFNEEAWNELPVDQQPKSHAVDHRGGKTFQSALEKLGWVYEGEHKLWTKYLEDVRVYSWIALEDGMPVIPETTTVILGENATVKHYREKNIDLYKKDRDYYSYTSLDKTKTFAEHLQDQYDWVKSQSNVHIKESWPD